MRRPFNHEQARDGADSDHKIDGTDDRFGGSGPVPSTFQVLSSAIDPVAGAIDSVGAQ